MGPHDSEKVRNKDGEGNLEPFLGSVSLHSGKRLTTKKSIALVAYHVYIINLNVLARTENC